jgi:N-ethylmaleimide reductase
MPSLFDPHQLGSKRVLKNRIAMAPMTRTRTSAGDVPNAPWGVANERAANSDVFAHDSSGKLTFVRASAPRQMSITEISGLVTEFTAAFRRAAHAGFDGVEIHAANGYLFDQLMNSTLNTRTDAYGSQTPQTRIRLLLEVVDAAIRELSAGNVGVRVSPFGRFNNMPPDPHAETTPLYLCDELSRRGIAYLHLVYQLMPAGNVEGAEFKDTNLSDDVVNKVREAFNGTLIWCGGFTKTKAQAALDNGCADLIAFGRPFIANPDLATRLKNDWPLAEADQSALYTRNGEKGYTDFPNFTPHP